MLGRIVPIILAMLLLAPAAESATTLYLPRQTSREEFPGTGIALVNAGSADVRIVLRLRNAVGEIVSTSERVIAARTQFSATLTQLFSGAESGWITIETESDNLSGFWLFGDFVTFTDGARLLQSADAVATPAFTYVNRATELNVLNLDASPHNGTLHLLSSDGKSTASAPFTVSASGIFQGRAADLFPAYAGMFESGGYWIAVETDAKDARLLATSVTRNSADSIATNAAGLTKDHFVFAQVVAGNAGGTIYNTELILANMATDAVTVNATLMRTNETKIAVTKTISGMGILRSSIKSLFGLESVDGWLDVRASKPIHGVLVYTDLINGGATAVDSQQNDSPRLILGHIADLNPWWTGVALVNASSTDALTEVYAVDADGNLIGGPRQSSAATFTIPAQSKKVFLLSDVLPVAQRRSADGGYIYVRTSNGVALSGTELFFLRAGNVYASVPATAAAVNFEPPDSIVPRSYLNLDFETRPRDRLISWGTPSSVFEIGDDTSDFISGGHSLRLRGLNSGAGTFGAISQLFPVELVRGHHVRITGWMKTENAVGGTAGFWWRVDGASGTISLDNAPPPEAQVAPNSPWTQYTIDRDVSPAATQIAWGMFFHSGGTIWFDDIRIAIDGVPLSDSRSPMLEPTSDQLDWLHANAIPFNGTDPSQDHNDLLHLKDIVGSARIVGLGEATHGTREFFQMKHRILEMLVTEMGFTIFSIEANMPEAYRLNDYVLYGIGDPRALLRGMYFWTWNTQEVLDMILWMRQYNASGKGRVQFTGFDMQTPTVAMQNVRDFVIRYDPGQLPAVASAITLGTSAAATTTNTTLARQAASAWQALLDYLFSNRTSYVERGIAASEVDWAIQNARVSWQAMQMRTEATTSGQIAFRDRSMAENVQWIADQSPGEKIVLWAHNGHIARTPGWEGAYLAARYGADYLPIQFRFNEGQYNAFTSATNGRLTANDAVPSFPGSAEYAFHTADIPYFVLDLRTASLSDQVSSWLRNPIYVREVGAVAGDGFFVSDNMTKIADVLIYIEHSSPSRLLQ